MKLTPEEVADIKSLQETYAGITYEMGELALKIHTIKDELAILEKEQSNIYSKYVDVLKQEESMASLLTGKYGEGVINTVTGEINNS